MLFSFVLRSLVNIVIHNLQWRRRKRTWRRRRSSSLSHAACARRPTPKLRTSSLVARTLLLAFPQSAAAHSLNAPTRFHDGFMFLNAVSKQQWRPLIDIEIDKILIANVDQKRSVVHRSMPPPPQYSPTPLQSGVYLLSETLWRSGLQEEQTQGDRRPERQPRQVPAEAKLPQAPHVSLSPNESSCSSFPHRLDTNER